MLDIAGAAGGLSGFEADVLKIGSLQYLIYGGSGLMDVLHALVTAAEAGGHAENLIGEADAVLIAPIPVPKTNVFCVGRNYAEHIAEGDRAQKANAGGVSETLCMRLSPCS